MSQSVICFALCLFFLTLIRCGSSCFSKRNPCPIPKLVSEYGPLIRGGRPNEANRDEPIPYQLSLRFHNLTSINETCRWDHICGAVILDEFTAVTAAHCFDSTKDVSRYRLYAGENRLDVPNEENEQVLAVKKVIIHPDYIDVYNGNDLAVVHVDKFVLNRHAQPALLSSVSTQRLANLRAVISGWGDSSHQSGISNFLQEGNVTIESPAECLERLTQKMGVPVRQGIVCAHDNMTRTCTGDSGGPLVIQNYKDPVDNSRRNLLVGITSFGPRNCSRDKSAGVFTEISHFYNWIQVHQNPQLNTSCSVVMEMLPLSRALRQTIYPHAVGKSLEVLCDFETDGGGWTIIQKRSSGPKQEFNRNWTEYETGFGSLDKNFWIGLENIRALTQNGDQELRIELEDFQGEKRWAKYSNFSVSDASYFYRLSISGYSGNAGNDMINPSFSSTVMHNGMRFSTFDKDNDKDSSGNCAVRYSSGWWFNQCFFANLNGFYYAKGETASNSRGIIWYSWKGAGNSLAKTEMKIRTRK